MKRINLLILILVGSVMLSCQSPKQSDPFSDQIQLQLDSLLAHPGIEALSLGIIQGEKEYIFHKGNLLNGSTPTDETLYEIASLTKTFTGTLLAQAIQEKKVALNEDIRKYLSESLPNLAYNDQGITFRHLVTHQSGLPHMFPDQKGLFDNPDWDKLPFQINELQEGFSRADFFEALAQVQLDTTPGLSFSYSNAGANLLGYLLEEIYEESFEELLKQKILSPLLMDKTQISKDKLNKSQLALGLNVNKVEMPLGAKKDMSAEGGIISTTEDMLKYLQFHLDEVNEVVALSHQHLWDGKFGDFEAGLFWQINKNGEGPEKIFQNGGAYGTSSWVTLIPEKDQAVFIVTNVSGPDIHQKLNETTEKIIEVIETNSW